MIDTLAKIVQILEAQNEINQSVTRSIRNLTYSIALLAVSITAVAVSRWL